MSKITYNEKDEVKNRQGEFYEIGSCYTTPRSIGKRTVDTHNWRADSLVFHHLFGDVDELLNKPRRFFDHMLSLVEYMRDNDPMLKEGNHKEYWAELVEGCEMWLSAVENGLYAEVEEYAVRVRKPRKSQANSQSSSELAQAPNQKSIKVDSND